MATTYSGPHSTDEKWRRTIIRLRHRPFLQQTWNRRTIGAHLEKLLANSFAQHSFWSWIQINLHTFFDLRLRMKRWLMTDLLSTDHKRTDERNICFVRTSSGLLRISIWCFDYSIYLYEIYHFFYSPVRVEIMLHTVRLVEAKTLYTEMKWREFRYKQSNRQWRWCPWRMFQTKCKQKKFAAKLPIFERERFMYK